MIKESISEKVRCAKCGCEFEDDDDKEESISCQSGSGHLCCNKCLKAAVRSAIAAKNTIVSCPVQGCFGKFKDDDVENRTTKKMYVELHSSTSQTIPSPSQTIASPSQTTPSPSQTTPSPSQTIPLPSPSSSPSSQPLHLPAVLGSKGLETQIIDEDGHYCLSFGKDLGAWGKNLRKKIRLVSIIGPQSTGKSTLLNGLFGTEFPTLNSVKEGLHKQTRGLWMGNDRKGPVDAEEQILIMDVEGVDGAESAFNPNAKTFENRSSLFALCMSSVVIVNVKENTLKRVEGGCQHMLEAVFKEVRLIHEQSGGARTLLLFIIRDYNKQTPISKHEETIMAMLAQTWKESPSFTPTDLFDVQVYALPSLLLPPPAPGAEVMMGATSERAAAVAAHVEGRVAELRAAFHDPSHPMYVFQGRASKAYEGVGELVQLVPRVWESVEGSQQVVMESMRELTAMQTCLRVRESVFETVHPQVNALIGDLERLQRERTGGGGAAGNTAQLCAQASAVVRTAIDAFREQAPTNVESVHTRVLGCITRDLTDFNDAFVRMCGMSADAQEMAKLADEHQHALDRLQREVARRETDLTRLQATCEQRRQQNARLEKELAAEKARAKEAEQELAAMRRLGAEERRRNADRQKVLEQQCAEQQQRTVEMERQLAIAREEERKMEELRKQSQLEANKAELDRAAAQQMLVAAQANQAARIAEERRREWEADMRRRQEQLRRTHD